MFNTFWLYLHKSIISFFDCFCLLQIGPIELPARLNGENYLQFLQNSLDGFIEAAELPEDIRNDIIFLHDGCPAHYYRRVVAYLNERFPNRWIGRGSTVPWPARSPDLNVCDYFLWGHIKSIVYKEDTRDRAETLTRIRQAFASITPQMIQKATENITKRLDLCIRNEGRHFEQHLH